MNTTLEAPPDAAPVRQRWRDLLTPELLIAFSIGARLVMLLWVISEGFETQHTHLWVSDINRYRDIGMGQGVPYRDFDVEFPPISWLVMWLTAQGSLLTTYVLVVASQMLCEIAAVWYVGRLAGRRAAAYLLVLNLPLVMLLYRRIDLLSVALLAAGLYHALRRSQRVGGLLLGLAVMAKLWPAVVLPVLHPRRHRSTWLWAAVTVLLVIAGWVLVAGWGGPLQVLTFRGSTGWQVESLFGNAYLLFSDAPVEWQGGAHRIGVAATVWRVALVLALAVSVLAVAWLSWHREERAVYPAAGATVLLFLVLAPLLSPQYMGWVTLVVALAAAAIPDAIPRQTLLITGLLAAVATIIVYPPLYDALLVRHPLPVAVLTFRNVLLCALLVLLVARLREVPTRAGGSDPEQS